MWRLRAATIEHLALDKDGKHNARRFMPPAMFASTTTIARNDHARYEDASAAATADVITPSALL